MSTLTVTPAELAAQVSKQILRWREYTDQLKTWLAGSADGGPEGDGRYPLTDANGNTYLILCPAAQEAAVASTVDGAAGHALRAEEAALRALSAAGAVADAEAAAAVAASHAQAVNETRSLIEVYVNDAGTHAANARTSATAAREAAESVFVDEAAMEQALLDAAQHAASAESARIAAEQAAAAAQTFDPSGFATHAQVASKVAEVVGSAPETLDTLNELASALGNDPNFAATISNRIGQKLDTATFTWDHLPGKPLVFPVAYHTHQFNDIVGLQAAFDTKAGLRSNVHFRDVTIDRGDGTGALFMGSDRNYLYRRHDAFVFGVNGTEHIAWHSGNFNPDTKHAARAEISDTARVISNWNDAVNNGWYMASGATNAPPVGGAWVMCKVTRHNALWVQQEAWIFTEGAETKRWRRHLSGGAWGAWSDFVTLGSINGDGYVRGRLYGDSVFYADVPYGTQAGALAIRWNGNRIWQLGSENNGDFKLWAYSDSGAYKGNPLTIMGDGRVGLNYVPGSSHYAALQVGGGITSRGGHAGLNIDDRGNGQEWTMYASGGTFRIWSGTDLVSLDRAGRFAASGLRATSTLDQGASDWGVGIRWNTVTPGTGMTDFINHRQGGSGGFSFSTRINDSHAPLVTHVLRTDGRIALKAHNGPERTVQPRIFVQPNDPGDAATDGDLWIW